jgi:hypothetical protein
MTGLGQNLPLAMMRPYVRFAPEAEVLIWRNNVV